MCMICPRSLDFGGFSARISRVRKRQRQDECLHARLSMAIYDEQREREMRSISSLLICKDGRNSRNGRRMDTQFEKRKNLICELVADEQYVPMKEKELAAFMQVTPADKGMFREVLGALLSEGKIQLTKQGRYVKPDANRPVGTFISHARGFGFVEVEGYEEDFFIPDDKTGGRFSHGQGADRFSGRKARTKAGGGGCTDSGARHEAAGGHI